MAEAGSKFEEVSDSPELNNSPRYVGTTRTISGDVSGKAPTQFRDDRPNKEDPIYFDETGRMVDPPEPKEEQSVVAEAAEQENPEIGIPKAESTPDYLQSLADSQRQMAEYLTLQQELKEKEERAALLEQQKQEEAYYQSEEYVTKLCEGSGLDPEDPIHRQLIYQRLEFGRQNHEYNQRLQAMEQRYYQQEATNAKQRNQRTLEHTLSEAAAKYQGVSEEMLDAARHQANLLVQTGMTPDRAVTESMKFIRLAAKQSSKQVTNKVSERQQRLDKINNLGPGRGAKSHRKTEITIAEADRLIEKYGFLPS